MEDYVKLLLYDMGTYTQLDIMDALKDMGIQYKNIVYKLKDIEQDAYFEKRVRELLEQDAYNAIFSVNYYPVVAKLCHEVGLPYISWSYDSPLNIPNMEDTLGYETNYVFFFDRAECQKYWNKGHENVYHMPLAVNTKRLESVVTTAADRERYSTEVSMVGQLYDTALPILLMPLSDYVKGYFEAIVEAQLRLYGGYILDDVITQDLVDGMNKTYQEMGQSAVQLDREATVVTVAKHITHTERMLLLDILSEQHQVYLYGPSTDEALPNVTWRGSAGYFDEMPKVFKLSKINLNISLKCIQSGIPLRALDILGCGGFLLTNYQPEIAEYFIDGEEVVMYTSLQDAVEKCAYYLEHEEERARIARNGFKKVQELFGYEDKLREMLGIAGLNL